MNLSITGRHLEVTPAINEYVKTKLARVARHFDNVIDTQVKPFRPSAAWKYRRANKAVADSLTAQEDNKGVFVQGPHGESVYVHFSGGDIALTVWGRSGRKVNVRTADNMHATTEQF